MKDLKIEYRDGKLVDLSIDGVSFKQVTAISFKHEGGSTPPEVSLTFPISTGERLVHPIPSRENLQTINK